MSAPPLRRALSAVLLSAVMAGLLATLTGGAALAQSSPEDSRVIEILPLRGGFIDPPVSAEIDDVITRGEEGDAELVVLQYSSAGGVSADLDALLDRFADASVPVAVYVGPLGTGARAAGAAGLLWLAADVRAVAADATVGPIDPVDLADLDAAPDRIDTVLERAVGDAELAERLRTEAVGADELVEAGVATLGAQGLEPLLVDLDGVGVTTADGERALRIRADEVEVRFHSLGVLRRVLHAATTAPFIYLLLVLGLGMLLFEVFQPGFGVAGLAGLVTTAIGGFGLFVLPVTWWAVALVVLGLLLYALDTAIAGFGPVTLAATAAFAVGSWAFYDHAALALPWWLVAATTLTVFVFFVFVMTTILRAQSGPEGVSVDDLVGRPGIVRSVLNPEGHVYIDGALWRARWTGGTKRVKVGTPVKVHGVDGPVVLVDAFEAAAAGGDAGGGAASAPEPDTAG